MRRNTADNEAYFASVDPQNAPSDDDLVEVEWKEERQIKRFQRYIALWIMEATEEETAPLIKNATLLGEWLTEALEEMK